MLLQVVGAEVRRAVTEAEVKLPVRQLRAAAARNKRRTIKQQQQEGVVVRLQLASGARFDCAACLLSHLTRCDVSTHVGVAVHYQNNKHFTCCHMNALCSFQQKQQQHASKQQQQQQFASKQQQQQHQQQHLSAAAGGEWEGECVSPRGKRHSLRECARATSCS